MASVEVLLHNYAVRRVVYHTSTTEDNYFKHLVILYFIFKMIIRLFICFSVQPIGTTSDNEIRKLSKRTLRCHNTRSYVCWLIYMNVYSIGYLCGVSLCVFDIVLSLESAYVTSMFNHILFIRCYI